jgi:hypothetical protein
MSEFWISEHRSAVQSFKWILTVLAAFAMQNSARSLFRAISVTVVTPLQIEQATLENFLGLICALISFRFGIGNIRMLDRYYLHHAVEDPDKPHVDRRCVLSLDVLATTFMLLVVVGMSLNLNDPHRFFGLCGLLLASDILWIVAMSGIPVPEGVRPSANVHLTASSEKVWLLNNLGHLIAGAAVYILLDSYILLSILATTNCIIDLVIAQETYFPKHRSSPVIESAR